MSQAQHALVYGVRESSMFDSWNAAVAAAERAYPGCTCVAGL
jgi:hypothetical protein